MSALKKIIIPLVLLAAAAVAFFSLGGLDLLAPDRGALRARTRAFMEDIQFKDYNKAASYHAPADRATVDIPYLLHRLFRIPPEQLDIREFRVLKVDIDSSGRRGRVLVWSKVKLLNRNEIREPEVMFYWRKASAKGQWYMKLEDSLRRPEADKGKKH